MRRLSISPFDLYSKQLITPRRSPGARLNPDEFKLAHSGYSLRLRLRREEMASQNGRFSSRLPANVHGFQLSVLVKNRRHLRASRALLHGCNLTLNDHNPFHFDSGTSSLYAPSMFGKASPSCDAKRSCTMWRCRVDAAGAFSARNEPEIGAAKRYKLLVQVVMARLKENGKIDDARVCESSLRGSGPRYARGEVSCCADLRARV